MASKKELSKSAYKISPGPFSKSKLSHACENKMRPYIYCQRFMPKMIPMTLNALLCFSVVLVAIFVELSAAAEDSNHKRGSIHLRNNCPFPLYVEAVANVTYLNTVLQPGRSISDPYRLTIDGKGTSLKIATQKGSSNITQVEYSACFPSKWDTGCLPLQTVFYDLSNINGNPLMQYGIRIEPSFENCITITCPPNVRQCDQVYNNPDENYATKACDSSADLKVDLCLI